MNRQKFDYLFKIYKPIQHTEELYWLIQKVENKVKPKVILEIGTNTGGTLAFWDNMLSEGCNSNCLLMCIDVRNMVQWDISKSKNNIKLIIGDSARKETIDKVKHYLQKEPVYADKSDKLRYIDFLFIDGGHLESQVTADYQNYSPLVRRNGGLIAFHDIFNNTCPGCIQFWNKVKERKYSIKYNQGIGVIWR